MLNEPLLNLDLPGVPKLKSGKVREIFDLGDAFLLVATDRISAFDCIMPNGIPRKGEVLTQLSHFWFERFSALVPNHLLARANDPLPVRLQPFAAQLSRRSMIVKKAQPLPIECVVRGYLAGSGWKEYQRSQTVCGIQLPAGLRESSELPEPIFTPATKAESGHDENISFEQAARLTGADIADQARAASLKIYTEARAYAHTVAAKLAAKPLSSLVETKRLMKKGQSDLVLRTIAEEGVSFGRMLREPAAREAFGAFMQKRKPDFSQL